MSKMTLSEELTWRGFVNQTTFSDITQLDDKKRTFYWGVDPSAPSLTIGNLAAAMMVKVFIKHGYTPILLVGGATGLIGDPDGKAQERDLKNKEEINTNKASITRQYEKLFAGQKFQVVDNYDWFSSIGYLEFLREVGKHVPMRQMLGREFVQNRLGEGGAGISYAEFSYSLIQGYDFLHLFEQYGVTLQLSGADQWGNCIAGVDLIRRKTGQEAHVFTSPLVINKTTGAKFGKTESGAVWLDPEKTSPFQFYQFWLNVDDNVVEDYLKVYTELDKAAIEQAMTAFRSNPGERVAQKTLAVEATRIVHGAEIAQTQVELTEKLFSGQELTQEELHQVSGEFGVTKHHEDFSRLVVETGLASSVSEARRLASQQAFTLNGKRVGETSPVFNEGLNLLKKGKNNFAIVEK